MVVLVRHPHLLWVHHQCHRHHQHYHQWASTFVPPLPPASSASASPIELHYALPPIVSKSVAWRSLLAIDIPSISHCCIAWRVDQMHLAAILMACCHLLLLLVSSPHPHYYWSWWNVPQCKKSCVYPQHLHLRPLPCFWDCTLFFAASPSCSWHQW